MAHRLPAQAVASSHRARLVVIAIIVSAVLTLSAACSTDARGGSSSASSSESNVVDGITIPPPYVSPPGTVVPGPNSCPVGFGATLSAAASENAYMLDTQLTAHLITCTYQSANVPAGACSKALILINTEPQAFAAFNRWDVETGQNSMWTNNPALRPTPIGGIGILAEWVPALLELGTGNDTTWVSVTLTCPADTPAVLNLAKDLAAEGLGSTAR